MNVIFNAVKAVHIIIIVILLISLASICVSQGEIKKERGTQGFEGKGERDSVYVCMSVRYSGTLTYGAAEVFGEALCCTRSVS